MQLHTFNAVDIVVPHNRQRKEFHFSDIVKLASSISQNGLIHPVVVRRQGKEVLLVAGERRLRALAYVWNFGESVKCGDYRFDEGKVPCLVVSEMDDVDAFEMELEENIRRSDITWQEKASATSQLFELRRLQAQKANQPEPTISTLSEEIRGNSGSAHDLTRREVIVNRYLKDPDVAKAGSLDDAFKVIKRKEDSERNARLAESVGATFTSAVHQLHHGDCFAIMKDMLDGQFDVILTDPPYGIDAQKFNDSGGKAVGNHFYDDSFKNWFTMMKAFTKEAFRLAKPQAHAYLFCDVDNFTILKGLMGESGWNTFRTPLVWVNPTANRVPWLETGPRRNYQLCLYAEKGGRPVTRIYSDVLTFPSDANLGHSAQKPVALYADLLRRSAAPGDSILDPFGGSGPLIPACHSMKCRATYIEMDAAAYGIAVTRLKELE